MYSYKKLFTLLFICATVIETAAQVPEDILKFSMFPQQSTARIKAIGGASASLGGDITATFVNPAGLGFYKSSDFVFSPGFGIAKNKYEYRDSLSKTNNNFFNLGPTGFIFAQPENKYQNNGYAFSIALSQQASFVNRTQFSSLNNLSSFSEQFAEEFTNSKESINSVLSSNSPYPYTSAPALNTFLIDTVSVNGSVIVRGAPENILNSGEALFQQYDRNTNGGIYELALGAAINNNKQLLIGGSLGIPIVYYKNTTTLTERDTSAKTTNGFSSSTYIDDYTTSGAGFNLKIGAIYRPVDYVRLGLAIHSPSFLSLTDTRMTTIKTALESPSGNPEFYSESSNTFTNGTKGKSDYTQQTPWKIIGSASYVFRETENVKKQRGFVTADLEYINYGSGRFRSNISPVPILQRDYFRALKEVIQDEFKSTINAKVGAELKFNTIMLRQGFAYYGNPYRDSNLKATNFLYTGGLGYRNKGFFADLAYELSTTKNNILPYRLSDRPNTFATTNTRGLGLAVTVGVKL